MASLEDWRDLDDGRWKTLLLGNGMSINVSPRFDYGSLCEEARRARILGRGDEAIFEVCGTTNFEAALSKLGDAIAIAEALEKDPGEFKGCLGRFEDCFRSIQETLGRAVREVHLDKDDVPEETLGALQDAFLSHRTIFTTSYDLLAYWAIGHRHGYQLFCDCFWGNDRNEFDPDDCTVRRRYRPIYYLHGALHLVVGGDGATWKLTRKDLKVGDREILDRFDKTIPGDPTARPLLVTEGSSRNKLQAIEANDYLSHAYDTLKEESGPLLVFGHSLEDQDQHLIDAIKASPDRPIAISMRAKGSWDLDEEQARIRRKLGMEEVYFYDAATHPLGSPDLRAPAPARRRRPRKRVVRRG